LFTDLRRGRSGLLISFFPGLILTLKHRSVILSFAFFFLILYFSLISAVFAGGDDPFVGPSNWGATGLMEDPTARVMKEDTLRIGAGEVFPYRYYYGAMGLLKGLEVDGKVTEIIGVRTTGLPSSYGDYKDKSIDLKYQFLPEDMYLPALALGIRDPVGNRLYAGQYLVASKRVYPFDFTLGAGNGRFGKQQLPGAGKENEFGAEIFSDPREWVKDARPFWGVQFAASEQFSLMMEYNPIRYNLQTNDPARPKYFTRSIPLHYNFGLRWKPLNWTEVDLSFQRGNEIGLSVSMLFDIGQPVLPIYNKPYKEKPQAAALDLEERIAAALKAQGFSDIGVDETGGTLTIRAQNDKYFYSMTAVGMIMKTIMPLLPPSVEQVCITMTRIGLPIFQVVTTRADIIDLYTNRLTKGEFFYLSRINTDVDKAPDIPTKDRKTLMPAWKPSFETLLNDPSGFFKYRLGLEGWLAYHPWQGASFVGSLAAYPLNNITTSNIPPSEAVRSDIFAYKQRDVNLARLMYDQIYKPAGDVYTRFAAGLLEIEYAGIDSEIAMPLADGRFLVGLEASVVKKRDPGSPLALKDYAVKDYYDVEFLNTRLNLPEMNMAVDLRTGRFLGGDFGARVTLIKYVKGITLFAWYSVTDTSVFHDPSNRGYRDKGIGVSIPMRLFEGTDSRTAYNYALSPWTRDVAQDIDRYWELFDFISRDTKVFLQEERGMVDW
jgi:hypothetical protein